MQAESPGGWECEWVRAVHREPGVREPRGVGASVGAGCAPGAPGSRSPGYGNLGQWEPRWLQAGSPGSGSPGGCGLCTGSPGYGNFGQWEPRWVQAVHWEPQEAGSQGMGAPVGAGGEPWGGGSYRTTEGSGLTGARGGPDADLGAFPAGGGGQSRASTKAGRMGGTARPGPGDTRGG